MDGSSIDHLTAGSSRTSSSGRIVGLPYPVSTSGTCAMNRPSCCNAGRVVFPGRKLSMRPSQARARIDIASPGPPRACSDIARSHGAGAEQFQGFLGDYRGEADFRGRHLRLPASVGVALLIAGLARVGMSCGQASSEHIGLRQYHFRAQI